jgi:hypothetical protein
MKNIFAHCVMIAAFLALAATGCQTDSNAKSDTACCGTCKAGEGTENFAKPGFEVSLEDGRLWILRPGEEKAEKHITLVGAGPKGMTVKALSKETALLYLASKPGFIVDLDDEGRIWVFRDDVKPEKHEKHITRVGSGPQGTTLKALDRETLDAYIAAGG